MTLQEALRAHCQAALAVGDWDRAATHANALAALSTPAQLMTVGVGGTQWAPAPHTLTGALWTDLPSDAQRAILYGLTPVPGLLLGRFVLGWAWPAASALGLLSSPLLIWAATVLTLRQAAATQTGRTTLGPRGR